MFYSNALFCVVKAREDIMKQDVRKSSWFDYLFYFYFYFVSLVLRVGYRDRMFSMCGIQPSGVLPLSFN